uniref:Uncharacterized protein n=1 Tax=Ciona savignyi TaxID=51511 RepID=H2YNC7_CIOSA
MCSWAMRLPCASRSPMMVIAPRLISATRNTSEFVRSSMRREFVRWGGRVSCLTHSRYTGGDCMRALLESSYDAPDISGVAHGLLFRVLAQKTFKIMLAWRDCTSFYLCQYF